MRGREGPGGQCKGDDDKRRAMESRPIASQGFSSRLTSLHWSFTYIPAPFNRMPIYSRSFTLPTSFQPIPSFTFHRPSHFTTLVGLSLLTSLNPFSLRFAHRPLSLGVNLLGHNGNSQDGRMKVLISRPLVLCPSSSPSSVAGPYVPSPPEVSEE